MSRVVALALLFAASVAHADAKSEAEKLYARGQYLDAAAKFRLAYDADPDPALLLNIAQAYRFGDDCAQSAAFYQRYLDKLPAAPDAEKVRGLIAEQQACVARDRAVVAPVGASTHAASNARIYAGVGAAVVGLGLAGVGGYELSRVGGIADDRDQAVAAACPAGHVCTLAQYAAVAKPFDDRAHDKQVLGGVLVGAGAVVLAAGAYLIISKLTDGDEAAHVIVQPMPGGAAVQGTWAF